MKYGIIIYKRKGILNIGDDMQLLAIKGLYEKIGVSYDDLIKVDFYDLTSYAGEDVILPICFPFYGYNNNGLVTGFSPRIHPVFLSLSLRYPDLPQKDIEYLQKNEPIGCRDEYTCAGLKKAGINAYLNGCMTLTLENTAERTNKRIYCIDVKDELLETVRRRFQEEIFVSSHIFSAANEDTLELAAKLLTDYRKNAKLVITSKMHCALPCVAVGLPVIFVPNNFDSRFTWLEDILHVYPPDEWDQIDWDPAPRDVRKYRDLMIAIGTQRLQNKNCEESIKALEMLYGQRRKREYSIEAFDYLKQWISDHWGSEDCEREYVIWGAHQCGSLLIDYIKEHYTNAKFTDFVDSYKRINFHGQDSKKIEEVNDIHRKYIIVCAATAASSAEEFARSNNISSDRICIYRTNGI